MADWTADQMRDELWAIYCATGADPDGDDARHLNPGEALGVVQQQRQESDAADDLCLDLEARADSYLALLEEATRALEEVASARFSSSLQEISKAFDTAYSTASSIRTQLEGK